MKDGEYRIGSLSYLYPDSGHSWLRRHVLHFRTLRTLRRAGCLFCSRGGQLGSGSAGTITVPSARVAEDLHRYYRVPRENIIVKKSGEEQ